MAQTAEQKKPLQVAPNRIRTSNAKRLLFVALTAGIMSAIAPPLTVPQMVYAVAIETIIDQANAQPAKASARTSGSLITFPAGTSGDELYQKGMYALINRQFQESINSFAKLQTSNPEMQEKIDLPYAEALLGLADNMRRNDPQQAIKLFKKAAQLDPRSVRAHFKLALVLTGQKDYAAAIASYQRAIQLNPEFPDTFFNLGFLYATLKNYAGAAEMYGRTVALNPDYLDEALFNLALAQSKMDDKEQSLANLKKALSINPNNQAAQKYLKYLTGGSEK